MIQIGLIGKNHTHELNWLADSWMQDGPPVCFLEGFPGTGKTSIARHLLERVNASGVPTILITAPETAGDPTDDILLDLAMELSIVGKDDLANAVDDGHSLTKVLHKIIEQPILIIVDEFQRTMRGNSGRPGGGFAKVLSTMASRKWLKGRVLLLTNRLVERARWSETYVIRRLQGMELDDGVQLLKQLLEETDQLDEIPENRRHDVVTWLGGNPRAIRVLTASLMYDSLDELIGLNPELWETKDRYVSAELVGNLERELLERTLGQLNEEYNRNLNRLSVHRKPFKREATEIIISDKAIASEFRRIIIDRFLMEHHLGWFNLHPIVREIGLQKLRQTKTEFTQAHGLASQYFTRHFSAKRVVGWGKLGGYFVEARYHLVNANRADELGEIATRFENHIRSTINLGSPVPKDIEELDERISVLSALLEVPGAKGLEYHLARCFQARGRRNDQERAIIHARRAVGRNAPTPTWVLCANLLAQTGQTDEAIALLKDGIGQVPVDKNVVDLYRSAGELLAQAGQTDEAIALLKDGIGQVPVDKSVVDLYRSAGELLAQTGQTDEAIALLKEGIGKVPTGSAFVLYHSAGELLVQTGQTDEAIALLKDGIGKVPVDKNVVVLYRIAGELLVQAGQMEEAIALLKEGIGKVPANQNLFVLYRSAGELLAQAGQTDEAIALLKEGIGKVPTGSVFVLYQSAGELLAQAGQTDEAIALLKDGIGKVPTGSVFVLYQSAGELLAQEGQTDEAIALLKDGIGKVPANQNLFVLVQSAGELLAQTGQMDEAIALLKDGMARIPGQYARGNVVEPILRLLCSQENIQALDDFLAGSGALAVDPARLAFGRILKLIILRDWKKASQIASDESQNFPAYRSLQEMEVFCNLCIHEIAMAEAAMSKIDFEKKPNEHLYWLKTWLELKKRDHQTAQQSLSAYLNRSAEESEVNEKYLLYLWDSIPEPQTRFDLAYFFPILPASLTGLPTDVVRTQYGPSVIRFQAQPIQESQNVLTPDEDDPTRKSVNLFISYAHEDEPFKDKLVKILAGLQRQNIINVWHDRRIEAGNQWYLDIQAAMNSCDLAVLLISDDFIASRFIQGEEIPPLLQRRKEEGMRVIPIILRSCMWDREPVLKDLQAIPKDGKPVITFPEKTGERDQVWTDIAKVIERQANALRTVD